MHPQKLCLKWNNHTTNLLSVLGSFQQKDVLVDVTISCENQTIKAHKMVLSACSPYFQSIFLENPCKHPVVIINGIKYEDITAILNFMYKGEVNVSQDGLSSFLQAAEALKVKGLAEVCGEKKNNAINQDVQQSDQNRPQRTDTPPRKRHRNRKRSISDSNDEGTARKHRETSSPEIHELSGDESYTGDNTSNGPPFNSLPRVPQNVYSRSHQSSSNLGGEEEEDDFEPSKLLEQTLTTDNVSMNNSNPDNNLRIERIMGNATEIESSSMQEPESPPDIKPIIDYGESSAGPSDGTLMLYSEQSQPGPSNIQDGSSMHDNSHAQGKKVKKSSVKLKDIKEEMKDMKNGSINCRCCKYSNNQPKEIIKHLYNHADCRMRPKKSVVNTFMCPDCPFKTRHINSIKSHLKRHGKSKQEKQKQKSDRSKNSASVFSPVFSCDVCKQEFSSLSNFECHRKYSHVNSYKCHICGETFKLAVVLKSHLNNKHNINSK